MKLIIKCARVRCEMEGGKCLDAAGWKFTGYLYNCSTED